MTFLPLTTFQWAELYLAALIIGFSKSGVPGTGIVAVPILAGVFGGRMSVATAIPMLVFADIFAVRYYWRDTNWDQLKKLLPGVLVGFIVGSIGLYLLVPKKHDPLNILIGVIVLLMLGVSLLRGKLGDRLLPTSPLGIQITGIFAGFTTMVSNAAGPIMQIYLVATKMPKEALLGTTSMFFLCVNVAKIPFYVVINHYRPTDPMWTTPSVLCAFATFPVILIGTFIGKRVQKQIPAARFNQMVLVFATLGALKLIFM